MVSPFARLAEDDWGLAAQELYDALKPVIQGSRGLLRRVRAIDEEIRKSKIAAAKSKFVGLNDLTGLDEKINDFLKEVFSANFECQQNIYYNFVPHVEALGDTIKVDEPFRKVLEFLNDPSASGSLEAYRLNMIVARILNESAGQSNKSNAGSAGEDMVAAVLNAAGLSQGKDYRQQFKSHKGSDTDFVLPNVNDYEDHNVEVFIATQLSTNDRARLASSELKRGGQQYLVTGNGMEVSKKGLQSIGSQILEVYRQDNIKLVCYGPEIVRERSRLMDALKAKPHNEELSRRLSYLQTHAISIEEFARKLQSRFVSSAPTI
jgi:hypothetical protein